MTEVLRSSHGLLLRNTYSQFIIILPSHSTQLKQLCKLVQDSVIIGCISSYEI